MTQTIAHIASVLYICHMFIRAVQKKDKSKTKSYTYYRLTHSYRVGNKTRQSVVLNLGKLEGVPKSDHKALADRIEELVTGVESSLFPSISEDLEILAKSFAQQISKEKIFPSNKGKLISKNTESNFQNVDLDSIEQIESRSIGGEWLVKQALQKLGITNLLEDIGLERNQIDAAFLLLTAKLLHPSSELEAERWLNENSGALELCDNVKTVTRYKLYQVASKMFKFKQEFDGSLYNNARNLFSGRNKIVIYDLTNMYFEGQMAGSEKAEFGRSKQKRNDRRLIGLALSIDSLGFVRHCQFYRGNVSEPETFSDLIGTVSEQLSADGEKPLIIMDAGISTEENLEILRSDKYNYDYVCVSRTIPKHYNKLSGDAEIITDSRGHKIELTKVSVEGKEDNFLLVKSDQKLIKEESIDQKLTLRLEAQLNDIKQKLRRKGTLKKINKVHEKVGAIKTKLSRIGWLYDITYIEDAQKGIVTDINWERAKERQKPKGVYFLRYTKKAIAENKIWDAYNLTRDVEDVFRCLKTDLDIRPVYHQKDEYIEPHIWLGVVAYQVVNYIRKKLKQQNIHHSWSTIVNKMMGMQSSLITVNNDKDEKVYIKLCTRPSMDQKVIFDALDFKHRPYVKKTKVVTQL